MIQTRRKLWLMVLTLAALTALISLSCLLDNIFPPDSFDLQETSAAASVQGTNDALEDALLNDPCMFKVEAEGVSTEGEGGVDEYIYVEGEASSPAWQEFFEETGLAPQRVDDKKDLIILPEYATADFSAGTYGEGFVYISIPDCDQAADVGDPLIVEEEEAEDECVVTINPAPPGMVYQKDEVGAQRFFFAEGSTSASFETNLGLMVPSDFNVELYGITWKGIEFPVETKIEQTDDGGLAVEIPNCSELGEGTPAPSLDEIAEKPCRVYTSPLPENAKVESCEVGRTCLTFPVDTTPDDWVQPAYEDWWMSLDSPGEPGYTVILASGARYDTGLGGQGMVSLPHCFESHRKKTEPAGDAVVLNTGFLPDSAELIYDDAGNVEIEITDPYSEGVDWQPLWDLMDLVDIQENGTGGYTAVFPRGSSVEPQEDGTFDILLGEGKPPTKTERMGWTWEDDCTLLLGPKGPDSVEVIKDSNANLSIDISPGPVADIWVAAAQARGLKVYPQDNGDIKIRFRFDSTLEYLEGGRARVHLSGCTPE